MTTLQFIGTTPADFIAELKKSLIPELREQLSKDFQPKQPTEYLTRAQVCEMLQINLSTLHRWRKDGIIDAFSISNRIYFKRESIEELINKNLLK